MTLAPSSWIDATFIRLSKQPEGAEKQSVNSARFLPSSRSKEFVRFLDFRSVKQSCNERRAR